MSPSRTRLRSEPQSRRSKSIQADRPEQTDTPEKYKLLEETQAVAHVGYWISGPDNPDSLEWSAETYRIFGVEQGAFDGRVERFFAMVHPDDLEAVRRAGRVALAGHAPYKVDHRIVRPDGTVRWVHEEAQITRDRAGQPRMLGVVQDITERKQVEAELSRTTVRLRTLARLNQVISSSLQMDEVLAEIAKAAAALTEAAFVTFWIAEEAAGTLELRTVSDESIGSGFPFRRVSFNESLVGLVVRARGPISVPDVFSEPEARAGDWLRAHGLSSFYGVPITLEGSLLGVLGLNGRVPFELSPEEQDLMSTFAAQAAVGVRNARLFQDVQHAYEELSRARDQLVQSQKMEAIGQLAGGVAHDFNNILTVITGRSQLLLKELRVDDPLRRNAELIEKSADRAVALTRQLLAFSRKQVLQPTVLEFTAVVEGVAPMLERLIGEHVELVVAKGSGVGRVKADRGQIEQVIINLVVNARDAMPDGGQITIEIANTGLGGDGRAGQVGEAPRPHVMLAVSDTGSGMPPEIQARIFALLHDEGARQGNWFGTLHRVRDRPAARRRSCGRERDGPWDDISDLPPSRRCSSGGAGTGTWTCRCRHVERCGDDLVGRGRGWSSRVGEGSPSVGWVCGVRCSGRRRRRTNCDCGSATDRSIGDRRCDAGNQRTRVSAAAVSVASGNEGPLHFWIYGRRDRTSWSPRPGCGVPPKAVFS